MTRRLASIRPTDHEGGTAKGGRTRSLPDELKVGPALGSAHERDTMRIRVYRALASGLMAGMFKPGEAVTLRTLAKRLGTSAMPVMEAVSRLIAAAYARQIQRHEAEINAP